MLQFAIPCLLGLESLVGDEVKKLGLADIRVENGRVLCRGGCRRNRQTEIGGTLKLNEYCSAFKEFFAYAYERLQFMVNSALKNNQ